MQRTLVLLLVVAVLAAGCGHEPAQDEVAPATEPSATTSAERRDHWGAFVSVTPHLPEAPAVYSVFSRPAAPRDEPAADAAEQWARMPSPARNWPGSISDPRVLLADIGPAGAMLSAALAEIGVCFGLSPGLGGGCGSIGPGGLSVAYDFDPDSGTIVYGLVGDQVERVEVVVGDTSRAARMGENGFALHVGPRERPSEVRIHERDGSTEVFRLLKPAAPPLDPPDP